MLFDTHTHLNVEQFKGEEKEAIERARENNVTRMAIVGFDTATIKKSLELSQAYEGVYSIIGWHPTEAKTYTDQIEEKLIQQLSNERVVAMGEMGLDYYWDTSPKSVQKEVFRRMK